MLHKQRIRQGNRKEEPAAIYIVGISVILTKLGAVGRLKHFRGCQFLPALSTSRTGEHKKSSA